MTANNANVTSIPINKKKYTLNRSIWSLNNPIRLNVCSLASLFSSIENNLFKLGTINNDVNATATNAGSSGNKKSAEAMPMIEYANPMMNAYLDFCCIHSAEYNCSNTIKSNTSLSKP